VGNWWIGCWQPEAGQGLKWLDVATSLLGPWICNSCGTSSDEPCLCELKQSHVISLIRPENAASRRVAEKLGEKLEGTTEILAVRR